MATKKRSKKRGTELAHRAPAVEIHKDSVSEAGLLTDIRAMIDTSRQSVARVVNSAMTLTYWSIGERIGREILDDGRGDYGKQLIARLAARLAAEYGGGFSRSHLFS